MGPAFQQLLQNSAMQAIQSRAAEQLRRITQEATKMKKDVEDKLRKTEGESLSRLGRSSEWTVEVMVVVCVSVSLLLAELEEKIARLLRSKEAKEAEVSQLLREADSLRQHIAKKAEEYLGCTS